MSKTPDKKQTSSLSPGASPPAPVAESPSAPVEVRPVLPEHSFLGLVKAPGGWCCVLIHVEGDRVVGREVLEGPETMVVAWESFRRESAKRVYLAQRK